jgi:hypothetical protein
MPHLGILLESEHPKAGIAINCRPTRTGRTGLCRARGQSQCFLIFKHCSFELEGSQSEQANHWERLVLIMALAIASDALSGELPYNT